MFRERNPGRAPAQTLPRLDPRRRLLEAMVHTVAVRGYERTTISYVVCVAELDEAVFSEHFHDKCDCLLQALEQPIARVEQATLELLELDAPWGERVRLGLERLLAALAADPALARVLLVEMLGAGREAYERRRVALAPLISLMEQGRAGNPGAAYLPVQTSEAIVGGVISILHRRALQRRTDELPALCADLTYFALLPYLDHERALIFANR